MNTRGLDCNAWRAPRRHRVLRGVWVAAGCVAWLGLIYLLLLAGGQA